MDSGIVQNHRNRARRIRLQDFFQKRQKLLRRVLFIFLPNHLSCAAVPRGQQLHTAMFPSCFDHTLLSLFEPHVRWIA